MASCVDLGKASVLQCLLVFKFTPSLGRFGHQSYIFTEPKSHYSGDGSNMLGGTEASWPISSDNIDTITSREAINVSLDPDYHTGLGREDNYYGGSDGVRLGAVKLQKNDNDDSLFISLCQIFPSLTYVWIFSYLYHGLCVVTKMQLEFALQKHIPVQS